MQKARFHVHHVLEGADKAHLKVQGGVLVQVPGGGVLLRPEHGGHLEHPLEHPHHGLLIELGGLGQKRLAAEIVQAEDVAAPLRPGVDDFGGVDLGKALAGEILPEGPGQALLDFEHRPLFQGPQDHRAQAQLGVQVQLQPPLGHGHRHGLGGAGQDLQPGQPHLHAPGGPALGGHLSGEGDGALLTQVPGQQLRGGHALHRPVRQAQGEEGHASQGAQGVDHAVQGDGLPHQSGQVLLAHALLRRSRDKFHNTRPFSSPVIRPGTKKSRGVSHYDTPRDEIIHHNDSAVPPALSLQQETSFEPR